MTVLRSAVEAQARLMLQQIEAEQPGVLPRLYADALAEIHTWADVQVRLVPDTTTDNRCSVAGGYLHSTTPPTLTVTASTSRRRQQFTVLHELGHHLQKNNATLALAVRRQRADPVTFEDAACDVFASLILIPDSALPSGPERRAPTASDVVALFERTQASRAACCVRVAEQLGTHGAVVVLDARGCVSFAAAHGDVFPPARGTSQATTPLIRAALRSRRAARVDDTYFLYRTGGRSDLIYGDVTWSDEYMIAVAVLDRAAWKDFAPPRVGSARFAERQWTCEVCGTEFEPDGTCERCRTPRCPASHCGCTRATERECRSCHLVLAPGRFSTRSDTVCRDCAG